MKHIPTWNVLDWHKLFLSLLVDTILSSFSKIQGQMMIFSDIVNMIIKFQIGTQFNP